MTQSKQTYMLFVGSLALMLIIGALAAQAQDTAVKKGGTWTAHTVKKPKSQGLILRGSTQLKAMSGYVLGPVSGNQVSARQIGGGGLGMTADCTCKGGTGKCSITSSGDTAICSRNPATPCNGACKWDLSGNVGAVFHTR